MRRASFHRLAIVTRVISIEVWASSLLDTYILCITFVSIASLERKTHRQVGDGKTKRSGETEPRPCLPWTNVSVAGHGSCTWTERHSAKVTRDQVTLSYYRS